MAHTKLQKEELVIITNSSSGRRRSQRAGTHELNTCLWGEMSQWVKLWLNEFKTVIKIISLYIVLRVLSTPPCFC